MNIIGNPPRRFRNEGLNPVQTYKCKPQNFDPLSVEVTFRFTSGPQVIAVVPYVNENSGWIEDHPFVKDLYIKLHYRNIENYPELIAIHRFFLGRTTLIAYSLESWGWRSPNIDLITHPRYVTHDQKLPEKNKTVSKNYKQSRTTRELQLTLKLGGTFPEVKLATPAPNSWIQDFAGVIAARMDFTFCKEGMERIEVVTLFEPNPNNPFTVLSFKYEDKDYQMVFEIEPPKPTDGRSDQNSSDDSDVALKELGNKLNQQEEPNSKKNKPGFVERLKSKCQTWLKSVYPS